MELHSPRYALTIVVGVFRMIAVCFEAVVRRTVQTTRPQLAESYSHPVPPTAPARGAWRPPSRAFSPTAGLWKGGPQR